MHFFRIWTNDILNDIWAVGLNQDCQNEEDAHPAWRNGTLLKDIDIRYLCVSVDVNPQEIVYDRVGLDRSLFLNLEPVDGQYDDTNLGNLTISWDHVDRTGVIATGSSKDFLSAAAWGNKLPILRVQIIPVNIDQPLNRDALNKDSRVFFLYPNDQSNNTAAWPDKNKDGQIIDGNCNVNKGDFICETTLDLTGFSTGSDQHLYVARIQSIYNHARLTVTGNDKSGDAVRFKNIQAIITATGQSNYVFERLRERIPLKPTYDLPEYAIDSGGDLCKILVFGDDSGVYLHEDFLDSNKNPPSASCSLAPPN